MTKPRYSLARKLASQILMMQEEIIFPIDVVKLKIKDKNITITSYQNYADITNTSIEKLTQNGVFEDAYFIKRGEQYVIFYNDDIKTSGRKIWSIAHELGHIVLQHENQGETEEIEANTFASQLLLPQCVLKKIVHSGRNVDSAYLIKMFGLSKSASDSCIRLVAKKMEKDYPLEYDDIILMKCKDFITSQIYNTRYYGIEDDEAMDLIRQNW